ncbi:TRAP transporter substrate-binding protein DctP [Chakrabartyella piscis]|uniref:TRAP transporter substrate-binding protein DctP n=1 Tax=Chakrabartyella piscis TaxID=2918914 RepID=UPI002958377A|nr:TRAP transporter substrate-binding protein DctP [Chakrabartyella piscis]
MKKMLSITLAMVMMLSVAGCGSSSSSSAEPAAEEASASAEVAVAEEAAPAVDPVVLKISIAETSTDIKAEVLADMIAEIEAETNGEIQFEVYYSNELGTLADVTEQMAMGANVLAGTSGDFYASYGSADIMASALQYALPTMEAVDKLSQSDLFASWCDDIEAASGLKVLTCNWSAAPRSVLSTKEVSSVADLQGLKVRVPGLAADAFFSALGSSTMSMAFGDIYTNMQQGMVEAAEAPLGTLYAYSLHEVAKYCYLSEHSLAPSCWAMSAAIFNSLSPENQEILQSSLIKYGTIYGEKGLETEAEFRAELEAAGVQFVEPSDEDKAIMLQAGADSFDAFPEMTPGLADEIAKIIG